MSTETFLNGRVTLHAGDCLDVVRALPDACVDSVVTDPPYALVSITRRFGKAGAKPPASDGATGVYARAASGFMGKAWDTGERAFAQEFWAEVWRVLKPGGHVAAFAGTRTYHRLACAIEDAGFEIRDQLAWVYGSGFPKSHDVSKGIDRHNGDAREKVRVAAARNPKATGNGRDGLEGAARPFIEKALAAGFHEVDGPSAASAAWQGWGTALKPAWEPICLARKPLIGTVAENVLAHGTGAINVDGCRVAIEDGDLCVDDGRRVATSAHEGYMRPGASMFCSGKPAVRTGPADAAGRWPANIVHDGSDEVLAGFPTVKSGQFLPHHQANGASQVGTFDIRDRTGEIHPSYGDCGSAARFFYTAKADADDRMGSKHPTVKPLDLMQWLVRLITPPSGTVLDPFAGTGTTGEAAWREGFSAVLIEREAEYRADIARRMAFALAGPVARRVEQAKARPRPAAVMPLFDLPAEGGGGDGSTASSPTRPPPPGQVQRTPEQVLRRTSRTIGHIGLKR